eukprot:gnl/TRDRNA2_/TRDRNA2_59287_c0_seq1.p1 gnl/TRDRNA2_/TRDRNA2_59287_c0~~gnl/TRDRNA2_/TRDRNA2_59287_c0_seq1.p1  ORF type:complete len:199 (+),score=15.70 gnl/TRDRNA2_/TRDRNA2_59287_c0_seq1:42-638(+)
MWKCWFATALACAAIAAGLEEGDCRIFNETAPPLKACFCSGLRKPTETANGVRCIMPWCAHGSAHPHSGTCQCEPGWRREHPSDPDDVCMYHTCWSNDQCKLQSGIVEAECPWTDGWPCDCGVKWARYQNGEMQCMSLGVLLRLRADTYRVAFAVGTVLFFLFLRFLARHGFACEAILLVLAISIALGYLLKPDTWMR